MENVMNLQKPGTGAVRNVLSFLASIDWRKYRSLVVLAALAIFLAIKTDGDFVSARNLTNLTKQVAINGILAVGMTYVILLGGIHLSVGSVVALAGIVTAAKAGVRKSSVQLRVSSWPARGHLVEV